jgi:hypothetical protein
MLVEIHHLESVELVRNCLDLILLIVWDNLDAFCVPKEWLSLHAVHKL